MSRLIFLPLIMLYGSLERVTMGRLAHGSIEVDQIICTPFCLGVGKLDAVTRFVHFFEILNSLRREHNDALRWARSLSFTQPRPTNAQSVSNLSGTGDVATQFFNLASGLHTFTLSNSGSGNFIVDLLDRNGNEVDNLENTIGDFNGSTAVHIDGGGTYLLNVVSGDAKSNGNWTVQVQ